jgi:ABC-type multidrug transport system fused ATPase/permease subunit
MRRYNEYAVWEQIKDFIDRHSVLVLFIAALMLLGSFFIKARDYRIVYLILLVFLILAFVIVKLTNKKIIFNERDLTVRTTIGGKRVKEITYIYEEIYKFIISRNYGINLNRRYAVYLDRDDEIIKLVTVKEYKQCVKLMEDIKNKAHKRVYDATDEDYILEDDLFRNYYKLKKAVREIQEEKEEEI